MKPCARRRGKPFVGSPPFLVDLVMGAFSRERRAYGRFPLIHAAQIGRVLYW